MLAARDQENLVHGHQTAAANKPLNRGLTPKTPGQKFPKTPLKLALNDENAGVVAGKATLRKRTRNQNENAPPAVGKGGEKNAFVTPGPAARTQRAPLGFKTTNAKARAFQTPAPAPAPTVQHENRPQPTSVSARKQRAKISHGKLNVFGDQESNDLEEREIEYCPPTPKGAFPNADNLSRSKLTRRLSRSTRYSR